MIIFLPLNDVLPLCFVVVEEEEEQLVVPDIIIISVSLSNSYPPRVKVVSSSRGQKEEVL